MKTIIEKLGIKPIEIDFIKDFGGFSTGKINIEDVRELEQQRNELLEALIEYYNVIEGEGIESRVDFSIIKKTDPQHRSWQQIKELTK